MLRAALFCLALAGCLPQNTDTKGTEEDLLDASFPDRLTYRYHCGTTWYLTSDEERTLRLQASFDVPYGEDPGTLLAGTLGEDFAEIKVYMGGCLWTPGCTDDPTTSCEQHIAHQYQATAGELTLELVNGEVLGEVTDLRLEGLDGEPPVELPQLSLPPAPLWIE